MRTDAREMLAVGIFGSRSRMGERIEVLLPRGRAFSARVSSTGIAASVVLLSGLMISVSFAPGWIAFAQPQRLTFEVSSVKPSTSTTNNGVVRFMPGG
jgi:hypothetical protein